MEQQSWLATLKGALRDFLDDKCPMRAAALSYYTAFALPPLLILLTMIAGAAWSADQVARAIESQFAGMIGPEGAGTVRNMINASERSNGALGTILGFLGLLFGATGALISLQDALNAVWEVKQDPRAGGLQHFLLKRLLSLGMILGLGFLLIVSLAVSAALSALGDAIGNQTVVMQGIGMLVSLAVLTVIFAAIFKYLPDIDVEWSNVWLGALLTAILLEVGKMLLGLYLGTRNPGSAFGAASALAVLLVWIYYAAMLVLLGAELTQAIAARRGRVIGSREA